MSENKATTERKINEADADLLEDRYASVRRGVEALVDKHVREDEWVGKIKNREEEALEIIEGEVENPEEIVDNNNINLYEIAANQVETTGSLRKEKLEKIAELTGYSRSSMRAAWSEMKEEYHPVDEKKVRRSGTREEVRKEAIEDVEKTVYRDEEAADEYLEELLEKARDEAKKIPDSESTPVKDMLNDDYEQEII